MLKSYNWHGYICKNMVDEVYKICYYRNCSVMYRYN